MGQLKENEVERVMTSEAICQVWVTRKELTEAQVSDAGATVESLGDEKIDAIIAEEIAKAGEGATFEEEFRSTGNTVYADKISRSCVVRIKKADGTPWLIDARVPQWADDEDEDDG